MQARNTVLCERMRWLMVTMQHQPPAILFQIIRFAKWIQDNSDLGEYLTDAPDLVGPIMAITWKTLGSISTPDSNTAPYATQALKTINQLLIDSGERCQSKMTFLLQQHDFLNLFEKVLMLVATRGERGT
ncbi:hypothetical protein FRB94_012129 [Tulasnella sp. JGI-2019a]|nr:hypothetical protein FRB94_012129 [Tulasnella sp. JGI-2019a]